MIAAKESGEIWGADSCWSPVCRESTAVSGLLILQAGPITNNVDMATAQTTDAMPNGEGEYKDGEHKEGKVCPVTGKTLQFQEQPFS